VTALEGLHVAGKVPTLILNIPTRAWDPHTPEALHSVGCTQGVWLGKNHRLVYHSTLGWRVMKKKKVWLGRGHVALVPRN